MSVSSVENIGASFCTFTTLYPKSGIHPIQRHAPLSCSPKANKLQRTPGPWAAGVQDRDRAPPVPVRNPTARLSQSNEISFKTRHKPAPAAMPVAEPTSHPASHPLREYGGTGRGRPSHARGCRHPQAEAGGLPLH
jgi:hypothetical protein